MNSFGYWWIGFCVGIYLLALWGAKKLPLDWAGVMVPLGAVSALFAGAPFMALFPVMDLGDWGFVLMMVCVALPISLAATLTLVIVSRRQKRDQLAEMAAQAQHDDKVRSTRAEEAEQWLRRFGA